MQGYLKHCCAWCLFRQASEQGENLALVSSVLLQQDSYEVLRLHDDSQLWVCRNELEVLSKSVCCMV